MSSNWSPQETPSQILTEKTFFQGCIVMGVGYGCVVALTGMCLHSLWRCRTTRGMTSTRSLFFLAYVSIIFVLGSISFATNTAFEQLAFVDYRNFPGGPVAFQRNMHYIPINVASDISFVLANMCAESLLIWRCMVIFKDSRAVFRVAVTFFSSLLFAGSLGMGILWLIETSSSSEILFKTKKRVSYIVPFFFIASLVLNTIVSSLIAGRLIFLRRRLTSVAGQALGSHYTNSAALVVESASLYTVFSLLFLIPFAAGSPIANAFLQIMGEVQIIAPLLIIYRVLEGKAWSEKTAFSPRRISDESSLHLRRLPTARVTAEDLIETHSVPEVQVTIDVSKGAI
ncbi:hypothetical protein BV22DRAFT_1006355 [Leucogyrophana mollusca]|uniref:Uncharacterized protein n=1 Tax=Leucogyrophana mollusca TaxID=85980 RepID=A0ACB8BRF8_9AGAM|nr:hypothetical protein BV22DRAFT_1006355 [Leucogyrophana mollusca]